MHRVLNSEQSSLHQCPKAGVRLLEPKLATDAGIGRASAAQVSLLTRLYLLMFVIS